MGDDYHSGGWRNLTVTLFFLEVREILRWVTIIILEVREILRWVTIIILEVGEILR